MAISLPDFKQYLGYPSAGSPATPSTGALRLVRKQAVTGDIPIPSLVFFSGNFSCKPIGDNPEVLPASQQFILINCQSENTGASQNIGGGRNDWITNQRIITERPGVYALIDQVSIQNGLFQGGADAVPATPDRFRTKVFLEDAILQRILDASIDQVRGALGLKNAESIEDTVSWDARIEEAVLLLGLYHSQEDLIGNLEIKQDLVSAPQSQLVPQTTLFPRPRIYSHIWRKVTALINHKRNVKAFMPNPMEAVA